MSASPTGVVLLHGKWGKAPYAHAPLAEQLSAAGHAVCSPCLPWALRRLYDATFEAALEEIAAEVAALRRQGCGRIVLAGHSLGACAALAYAARRGGPEGEPRGEQRGELSGLVLLAPAHFPDRLAAEGHTGESLAAARAALSGPAPDKRISVVDVNQGRRQRLRVAPAIYLSYFEPGGPAAWLANARALPPGLPVLWVIGRRDPAHGDGIDYAFDTSPVGSRRRVILEADHAGTPTAATDLILDWLRCLEAPSPSP